MEGRTDVTRFQDAVQGIYRLFKVATFHRLDNDAVTRAIELSLASIRAFGGSAEGLSMLFARDTVIVNGRLLQAPPSIYELAMEFGGFLVGVGINSFHIDGNADENDLRALLSYFRERLATIDGDGPAAAPVVVPDAAGNISPHIRLRRIKDHLLLGLEDPRLSVFERVLLTYALAIRVIRQLLANSAQGAVVVPPFFKRVSRQLALADYGSRPALLDVMLAPSRGDDRARLSVNAAIVAAAMVRRLVRDDVVLGRITFEAMLLDFGYADHDAVGHVEASARPALAAALAQIRTGELRGDAALRALVAFEAVSLQRGTAPEQVYFGALAPSLDARILATSRAFVDALANAYREGRTGGDAFNEASQAAMAMALDATGEDVAALLHDAIGLIPIGVTVRTERGFVGIVISAGGRPTLFDRPRMLLVRHADGHMLEPTQVDLADPTSHTYFGRVEQVVLAPDPEVAAVRQRMFGVVDHADTEPIAIPAPAVVDRADTEPIAIPAPTVVDRGDTEPIAMPAQATTTFPPAPMQVPVEARAPKQSPAASREPAQPMRRPEFVREPTPSRPIPSAPYSTMTGAEALRAALRAEPAPAPAAESARTNAPSGTHRTVTPSGTHRTVTPSGTHRTVGGQPAPGVRRGLVAQEIVRVPGMAPRAPDVRNAGDTGYEREAHVSGTFAQIEAHHAQPARRPSTMATGELDALLAEYLTEGERDAERAAVGEPAVTAQKPGNS